MFIQYMYMYCSSMFKSCTAVVINSTTTIVVPFLLPVNCCSVFTACKLLFHLYYTWRNFFNIIIFQISPLSDPLPFRVSIPDTLWVGWQLFWSHNTTYLHARSSVCQACVTTTHNTVVCVHVHYIHVYSCAGIWYATHFSLWKVALDCFNIF